MADPQTRQDIERRALALLERLLNWPGNARFRQRLLQREPPAVIARVTELEAGAGRSAVILPTQFDWPRTPDETAPPDRIGPFRIMHRLGAGGMGSVWQGQRDDGLYEQQVAIKFIHSHLGAAASEAFAAERRILARLEHPGIARLIDGGVTAQGTPYLLMEYVDGQAIDIAVANLPLFERINSIIKAAAAVQYAHSRLVAHADLKPSNVLVDRDGRVRLLDFGIARLLVGNSSTGSIDGPLTRAFASPQRRAGDGPSIADDVYALGETLRRVVGSTADADIDAVIDKACAAQESQRYGSVAELIADLERWREKLPVTARAPTLRYRAGKFVARHRIGVVLTAAAFLALTVTTATAVQSYLRAERARLEAQSRFDQVRQLARYQLFDLYDQLRKAPGTVAMRADIATKSSAYLDQLRIAPNAPLDLKLETASGYRRLAAVQGLSGTASLGQPGQARESLLLAERLALEVLHEKPGDLDAQELLGWIYTDRWTLLANNAESASMNSIGRGYFDSVLSVVPARSSALLGWLQTEKNRGYDLGVGDKPKEAIAVLTRALAALRAAEFSAADRPSARGLESLLLNLAGDSAYLMDDLPGALKLYRQQQLVVEAALRDLGETPEWLSSKAEVMFDLAGTLSDMTDGHREALVLADSGISAVKRVLEFGPDANAEKKLVMLYGQKSLDLGALGRHREAVEAASQSVAIRAARLTAAPQDPTRIRDLAIATTPQADLLARAGDLIGACNAAKQSVQLFELLKSRSQLGGRDTNKNLPLALAARTSYCKR